MVDICSAGLRFLWWQERRKPCPLFVAQVTSVHTARSCKGCARVCRYALVYSTCTFAPEENEQRIAALLAEQPDWSLVDIPKQHGFAPGRPEWTMIGSDAPPPDLARAARLWPHRLWGEGHFIALLRNDSRERVDAQGPWPQSSGGARDLSGAGRATFSAAAPAAVASWQAFEQSTLTERLPAERLLSHGDQLYLAPEDLLDLGALRVVRLGLWLGTLKPGRFEPAHALALALHPDEARQTVALHGDDVGRYLHGEALRLDRSGPDGWALVTIDGWPLGWGRRVGDVIKNFYPKGLRWLG